MRIIVSALVFCIMFVGNANGQSQTTKDKKDQPTITPSKLSELPGLNNSDILSIQTAIKANDADLQYVGYGIQNKENATMGAVSSARVNKKDTGGYANLAEYLQGRVSGITVQSTGSGYKIFIRGLHTFSGSNQPLIVVNGMTRPLSSAINQVDPSDVKSVDVLKGPAAAIYGSRGANGVIVITTK